MSNRRKFIKIVGGIFLGGSLFSSSLLIWTKTIFSGSGKNIKNFSEAKNRRWIMVIDLAKCDGCKACTRACTEMHDVPYGQEWIKVYEHEDNPGSGPYWFPRPCMQCDNPPCVRVCPVSATFKREDGIVVIDQNRCIGCRMCMAACPYSARYFNWSGPLNPETSSNEADVDNESNIVHRRGVVGKCHFCTHHLRMGHLPGCASGCKMGAVYFGDELEGAVTNGIGETVELSRMLEIGGGFRLMEDLGTKPRVFYLPPRNPKYPAPKRIQGF